MNRWRLQQRDRSTKREPNGDAAEEEVKKNMTSEMKASFMDFSKLSCRGKAGGM